MWILADPIIQGVISNLLANADLRETTVEHSKQILFALKLLITAGQSGLTKIKSSQNLWIIGK